MKSTAARQEHGGTPGPAYVEVALPVPLRKTFLYSVPDRFRGRVKPGSRVVVPFGKRKMTGFAVGVTDRPDEALEQRGIKFKPIAEVTDGEPLISEEILQLTKWTADYYLGSWGELLKASLPAGVTPAMVTVVEMTGEGSVRLDEVGTGVNEPAGSEILRFLADQGPTPLSALKERFGARNAARLVNRLCEDGLAKKTHERPVREIGPRTLKAVRLADPDKHPDLSSAQQRVCDLLIEKDREIPIVRLMKEAGVSASPVKTLEKRGIVEIFDMEVFRDPLDENSPSAPEELVLTGPQESVFTQISNAVGSDRYEAFLLHGVTGSGKTEVYIRAMKRALELGKSSLMLVPEIALTPVLSRRLRAVFGNEVAILHSSLSKGERFDEWRRIRDGDARIAIGTRSAVFAPLKDIGLVVVDEEHDTSYRQHEMPFYHGRDVAVVRAKFAGATVVLGSATPALESYHNSRSGKYRYLHLPDRIGDRPLATAEIVDLREMKAEEGGDPALAPALTEAIADTHAKGEQSIILLNRRGFSQFVLCRSCGETIKCRNCDITLTYHKHIERLLCHYCNFRIRTPEACPHCESRFLYFLGEGTEQLEKVLRKDFPDIRIARVDRDTTRKRKQLERVLREFSEHKIDMLIGTQMLAKGHDFPNVTLVGVVSVDTGLALPDFRSAERTFQILTQVAGRAGRGDRPGRVIIQTFHPSHYALLHAKEQSYEAFYDEEIEFRRKLNYPPFTSMASILVKHSDLRHSAETAGKLRAALAASDPEGHCPVLGPAPAALPRLKGEHRLQLIVRSANRSRLRNTIGTALELAEQRGCDMRTVFVEVDPVNLL